MIRINQTLIAAAVLAALSTAPITTNAETCGSCIRETDAQASQTRSAISSKIDQSTASIVGTIQDSIGAATNMLTKNAAAIARQRGDDAALNSQAQTQEQAAIKAAQGVAPMSCAVTSATVGGSGPSKLDYDASRLPPALRSALDASGHTDSPTVPPVTKDQQLADLGVGSCQAFAGTNTVRSKLCGAAGATPADANPYTNADIEASTLFDGPQAPGEDTPVTSVPATGPARDARQAYVSMLSEPTPPATPNGSAMQTPAYKAYLGEWAHYEAVMSMASEPAVSWDRWTTVDPQTTASLQAMAEDPAAATFLNNYFKNHPNSSMTAGVSQKELMGIEVERRIGNPDWIIEMAHASAETKAAEDLMLNAYRARIDFDRLTTERKMTVLLGQILAEQTDRTLRPQVDALKEQAETAGNSATISQH